MNPFTTRIAEKLVLSLVLLCSLVALVGSGWQVHAEYHEAKQSLQCSMEQMLQSRSEPLSRCVEKNDKQLLREILTELSGQPGVAYAAASIDGEHIWHHGDTSCKHVLRVSASLPQSTQSSIGNNGSIEIATDVTHLRDEVRAKFMEILLENALKVFLFGGLTLLLFQRLVTRHLVAITHQVENYNIVGRQQPLTLDRSYLHARDELDRLLDGINNMDSRGRQAYKALERNEQRLLLFFDATEEGILGIDKDGTCSFNNDACLQILGLQSYEDVMGVQLEHIFHYQSLDAEHEGKGCLIQRAMTDKCSRESRDGVITLADGRQRYISLRVYPVFNAGECSGVIAFFRDIHEQRELIKERELLSEAVSQAPVMLVITNREGIISYVNPKVIQLTGFQRQDIVEQSLDVLLQFAGERERQQVEELLMSGKSWQGFLRKKTKNGEPLMVSAVISPILDNRGKVTSRICAFRDLTYELELQDQLITSKKMEAVDRLSSSIAHEIGNPLFGVRSVIKDLRDRPDLDEKDKEILDLALGECNVMKTLVRDLRRLDRQQTPLKQQCSIRELVELALQFNRLHIAEHEITVHSVYGVGLPFLHVDKEQVILALVNLITNAVDAMAKSGGELYILTAIEGAAVMVTIADSGHGISHEHSELMFEPFFSTKPQVEGAGLGLTVAYSIIRNAGGDISCISEVGKGTTFTVSIPLN
jgi:PAS domain S-box-containing protein